MAKSFLEYFKTLLPNFSFDNSLLIKEYKKALTLLEGGAERMYAVVEGYE